jgi:hypothetical protein
MQLFPPIPLDSWQDTRQTLHRFCQPDVDRPFADDTEHVSYDPAWAEALLAGPQPRSWPHCSGSDRLSMTFSRD